MSPSRVAWVDYSKGICIILVVMMHSVTSYATLVNGWTWLHNVVEFAFPFRMPDFFLIAGLFLSRTINAPLTTYVDKKVIHFLYFYILWLAIQMFFVDMNILVSDPLEWTRQFFLGWVDPYQTMWFVYMLAVFYIFTRFVRKVPVAFVFAGAALLQTFYHAGFETGWSVIDRFMDRYLYFFVGYACAPVVFQFAAKAGERAILTIPLLIVWGVLNWTGVQYDLHESPLTSIVLAFVGAGAVVATGALLSRTKIGEPIRYAGANSIVVYLSFVIPMKVAHKIFYMTGWVSDAGTVMAISTVFAVVAPLVFHHFIKNTPLNFLYVRPQALRLVKAPKKPREAKAEAPIAAPPAPDATST
jgi:uncharacterized membrane protein YcfT